MINKAKLRTLYAISTVISMHPHLWLQNITLTEEHQQCPKLKFGIQLIAVAFPYDLSIFDKINNKKWIKFIQLFRWCWIIFFHACFQHFEYFTYKTQANTHHRIEMEDTHPHSSSVRVFGNSTKYWVQFASYPTKLLSYEPTNSTNSTNGT